MPNDTQTTPEPIRDGTELHRRMLAGETLHHGLAPGQDKATWWLRPSMTQVLARAVYAHRKDRPHAR